MFVSLEFQCNSVLKKCKDATQTKYFCHFPYPGFLPEGGRILLTQSCCHLQKGWLVWIHSYGFPVLGRENSVLVSLHFHSRPGLLGCRPHCRCLLSKVIVIWGLWKAEDHLQDKKLMWNRRSMRCQEQSSLRGVFASDSNLVLVHHFGV